MSHYIDAIVIPVPRANLDTYKRMTEEWGDGKRMFWGGFQTIIGLAADH